MGDCLLELRQDFRNGADVLFCQVAIHGVAQAHINPTVPEPADFYVDLAVGARYVVISEA